MSSITALRAEAPSMPLTWIVSFSSLPGATLSRKVDTFTSMRRRDEAGLTVTAAEARSQRCTVERLTLKSESHPAGTCTSTVCMPAALIQRVSATPPRLSRTIISTELPGALVPKVSEALPLPSATTLRVGSQRSSSAGHTLSFWRHTVTMAGRVGSANSWSAVSKITP